MNQPLSHEPPVAVRPDQQFETPEAMLSASWLSVQQKQTLLTQWAQDLEGKLRASDENMASQAVETSGELLRRVKIAQQLLNDPAHDGATTQDVRR